jgi:hypothetical protein
LSVACALDTWASSNSTPVAASAGITASAARRVELLLSLLGRDSTVALDTDAVVPVGD